MQPEVIALLFPEQSPATGAVVPFVTALLRRARLAGRLDSGKPIIDPVTREVIGCEIEPIADPAV